ncbi:MAG: SDR family NAD(P)-dependent oxidoreductase [Gammaproteobacteria bacterium]
MPDNAALSMSSFTSNSSALVIGATGGIGRALVDTLADAPEFSRVFASGRSTPVFENPKVQSLMLDLNDEQSVQNAVEIASRDKPLSLVITATGLLHADDMQPEKSWRSIDPQTMARSFAVNCTGPALVLKHVLPSLKRGERSVVASLSARVGSIGDNRLGGWYAYRSAKAALNMMVKTASIELARVNPAASVISLHPGTVDTALSKPFQANVPDGKLFDRSRAARQLLAVIDATEPSDSGNMLDWRGHTVQP